MKLVANIIFKVSILTSVDSINKTRFDKYRDIDKHRRRYYSTFTKITHTSNLMYSSYSVTSKYKFLWFSKASLSMDHLSTRIDWAEVTEYVLTKKAFYHYLL